MILSVKDLPNLEVLFTRAELFRKADSRQVWALCDDSWRSSFKNKYLGCIFDEPSIRTRWSFTSAFERMGGSVISSFGPGSTSKEKGESLHDMVMTASQYVDYIVLRQSESLVEYDFNDVDACVINAGDGNNEHPTQALLDAYTIWREFGRISDLNILVVGDVRQSRAIHSLTRLLGDNNQFTICDVRNKELWAYDQESLSKADVLYLNRVQLEREKSESVFSFGEADLLWLNDRAIIMNPGPRCEEMPEFVDKDPRSRYWQQVKNGMYIRMSLFFHILLEEKLNKA